VQVRYSMALLEKVVSCQWAVVRNSCPGHRCPTLRVRKSQKKTERLRGRLPYEGNQNFPKWESGGQLSRLRQHPPHRHRGTEKVGINSIHHGADGMYGERLRESSIATERQQWSVMSDQLSAKVKGPTRPKSVRTGHPPTSGPK
jgi:hypothetical protein